MGSFYLGIVVGPAILWAFNLADGSAGKPFFQMTFAIGWIDETNDIPRAERAGDRITAHYANFLRWLSPVN